MANRSNTKTTKELLSDHHNATSQDMNRMRIVVSASEDIVEASEHLTDSITKNNELMKSMAESTNILNKRIFWLNIFLLIVTALGVIITLIGFFK